jgi:hypothetical protein
MKLCATYKTRQWNYVQRIKQDSEVMCNVYNCITLWESQKSYAAVLATCKRNGKQRCSLTDWEGIRNEISWGNCGSQKKDVRDRRTWFTDLEADGEIWNLTYMEERKWEPLRQNVTRNMLHSERQDDTRLWAGLFQYFVRSVQHLGVGKQQHSTVVKTKRMVYKTFWYTAISFWRFNQQKWNGDNFF